MTEQERIFYEPPEVKKRTRWVKCSVCGHEWRSYGYGRQIRCPECYKQSHGGQAPGPGAEKMAELRAKRKYNQSEAEEKLFDKSAQNDFAEPLNDFAPQKPSSAPAPKEFKGSLLDKILNYQLGG